MTIIEKMKRRLELATIISSSGIHTNLSLPENYEKLFYDKVKNLKDIKERYITPHFVGQQKYTTNPYAGRIFTDEKYLDFMLKIQDDSTLTDIFGYRIYAETDTFEVIHKINLHDIHKFIESSDKDLNNLELFQIETLFYYVAEKDRDAVYDILFNECCHQVSKMIRSNKVTHEHYDFVFPSKLSDEHLVEILEMQKNKMFCDMLRKLDADFEIDDDAVEKLKQCDVERMFPLINEFLENINKEYYIFIFDYFSPRRLRKLNDAIIEISGTRNEDVFYQNTLYRDMYLDQRFPNILKLAGRYSMQKNGFLIEAYDNKKYAFLRIIDGMADDFLYYPTNSILFRASNYINLNELNKADILTMANLTYLPSTIPKAKFTPRELIQLCDIDTSSKEHHIFYSKLTCKRVDDKLRIIKKMKRVHFLYMLTEDELEYLAKVLSTEKIDSSIPFSLYIKKLIVRKYNAILSMQLMDKKDIDFAFRIRNTKQIAKFDDLQELKRNSVSADKDMQKLLDLLKVPTSFTDAYLDNIIDFSITNQSYIAMRYYEAKPNLKDNLLKIIKAELTGKMDVLKYTGLAEEIVYPITNDTIVKWKKNSEMTKNGYHFGEYTDFRSGMLIGEEPTYTCMNFASGVCNECLLSIFDGNKKVIYVKKYGQIVARAIIRLTKISNKNNMVSFIDVEKEEQSSEDLCVFLERMYSAHLSDEEETLIKKYLIEFVYAKAKEMQVTLAVSGDYYYLDQPKTHCFIYISNSKNGYQYLDSLSGLSDRHKGGKFYETNCYII